MQRGHIGAVELLIEKGCDVNDRDEIGITPLIIASQIGFADIMLLLIDKGNAIVDVRGYDGLSALYIASQEVNILIRNIDIYTHIHTLKNTSSFKLMFFETDLASS